jgi:hypothetical protein
VGRGVPVQQRADQREQVRVLDQRGQQPPQVRNRDRAEAVMEVGTRDPAQALITQHGDGLGGVRDSQAWAVGVAERAEQRVDLGDQRRKDGSLYYPVPDRRHVQKPHPPIRTRQPDGRERARLVCPRPQVGRHPGQALVRVLGEPGYALPEHPVLPVAGQHVRPGRGELGRVGDPAQGGVQGATRLAHG